MIKKNNRRLIKGERGATLVEYAIVIPLLLTLIFGIIEFGWIFNGYITLTSAVREGARQAIVSENQDEVAKEKIRQIIKNQARTFNLSDEEIIISFGNYAEETSVEIINAELPLLIGFLPVGNTYPISAKATMRQER